jgi:hypothetical protein
MRPWSSGEIVGAGARAMTARLTREAIAAFADSACAAALPVYESFGGGAVSPCCGSSLFCDRCATNLCFRMGPGCPDLDPVTSDLELVERVGAGLKPLACVVLSGKAASDTDELESRLAASGLSTWRYQNEHGVQMVALCSDKAVADLVDVPRLAELYRHAGFPSVADDVSASGTLRLTTLLEGHASIGSALTQLELEGRLWLLGLAYGYPVWSTVAIMLERRDGRAAQEDDGSPSDSPRRKRSRVHEAWGEATRMQVERVVAGCGPDARTVLGALHRALATVLVHAHELGRNSHGSLSGGDPELRGALRHPQVVTLLRMLGFRGDEARFWLEPASLDLQALLDALSDLQAEIEILNACAVG